MIVCHCRGISDRAIRSLVKQGASSPHDVSRACAAGLSCGGCQPIIEHIVDSERSDESLSASELAPAS